MNKTRKVTGLQFVVTSEKKDKNSTSGMKPDLSVYRIIRGKEAILVLSWPDMDMYIEWKIEDGCDGYRTTFTDILQTLEANTENAGDTRGQIYSYAAQALDSQHRLFLFAGSVYKEWFRFYRFDPSSVVVSEPVSLRDCPEVVLEVFAVMDS